MKYLVLFCFFLTCYSQSLQQLYIGYNTDCENQVDHLKGLLQKIPFVNVSTVDIDNTTDFTQALNSGMQILYMTPGNQNFTNNNSLEIQQFVSNGGILIFSAGFNDTRSKQISSSTWLNDSRLNVETFPYQDDYSFYDFVGYNYSFNRNYGDLHPGYRGYATPPSLFTTFGRLLGRTNLWGSPVKQIAPTLYFLPNETYRMYMKTNTISDYCMFSSLFYDPFLRNGYRDCWVYNFNYSSGHVVALPFTFHNQSLSIDDLFVKRALSVVAAACSINIENVLFPNTTSKDKNIVLSQITSPRFFLEERMVIDNFYYNYYNYALQDLAFELSLVGNVYIMDYYNNYNFTIYDLIAATQADTIVLGKPYSFNITYFLDQNKNIILIDQGGNHLNDVYSYVYLYDNSEGDYYLYGPNLIPNLPPAFLLSLNNLQSYRRRYYLENNNDFVNDSCIFNNIYGDCYVWSKQSPSGAYYSFLGWDFRTRVE